MSSILISTKYGDIHAHIVSAALMSLGIDTHIYHFGGLPQNDDQYKVSVDDTGCKVFINNEPIIPDVIWFRKITHSLCAERIASNLTLYEQAAIDENYSSFAQGLQFTLALHPNAINSPKYGLLAANKVYQHSYAAQLGFKIPNAIYMNYPDREALKTLADKDGNLIYKPFRTSAWNIGKDNTVYSMAESEYINIKDILSYSVDNFIPGIYQSPIHKSKEIRVCIMGEHCIALEQTLEFDTKLGVDWRDPAIRRISNFNYINLDASFELNLRKLLHAFNLEFATLDIVVDEDGNYHLLELNPYGQFLFMEETNPETFILRKCVKALLQKANITDVDHDLIDQVTMENFGHVKVENHTNIVGTGAYIHDFIQRRSIPLSKR